MSYGRALHILNQQKEEKDQSRIRATYATATGQTNENQTTRQNDRDNIFQQIVQQQNDKVAKQISILQKEIRTLTTIIRTICINSNIDLTTIVDESESDAMDILPSGPEGDEEEVPPTQQDQRRSVVPPLSPEEILKLSHGGAKHRGNNNGPPKFNRAKHRQNKLDKTESIPPNKLLKLTKPK